MEIRFLHPHAGKTVTPENHGTWKQLSIFMIVSFMFHVFFFAAVIFLYRFELPRTQYSVVQVDLVSLVPGTPGGGGREEMPPDSGEPVETVSEPVETPQVATPDPPADPPAPKPEPAAETIPVPVPEPPAEVPIQPEPVPEIKKADTALKQKPDDIKKRVAAAEKPVSPPEKPQEAQENPDETLKAAREDLARKVSDQEQKSQALARMQQAVDTRKQNGGSGSGGGSGAATGPGRPGHGPLDIYRMVLKSAIEQNWVYNDLLAGLNQNLEVRLLVRILRNGRIQDISYETRSGNRYLDESARRAIQRADPLPALPQGMTSYDVVVIFTPRGLK